MEGFNYFEIGIERALRIVRNMNWLKPKKCFDLAGNPKFLIFRLGVVRPISSCPPDLCVCVFVCALVTNLKLRGSCSSRISTDS